MIRLREILTDENLAQIAQYIKTSFNSLAPTNQQLTDTEANQIMSLIDDRLILLKSCYTIYPSIEDGLNTIKSYIKMYIVELVVEVRNNIKSLQARVGSEHRFTKFNPIDNDNINDAPIATDEETVQYADAMLTHMNFLLANTQALDKIYYVLRGDCQTFIA